MYTVRIYNTESQEIMEAECKRLKEALRIANVAYFSCGYDETKIQIKIISENGDILEMW